MGGGVRADLTRVTIDGADHCLHRQEPKKVAGAILNWLAPAICACA
jgi:pimeloyl-ACP methyl ester carboxylesterase